MRSLHPNQSNGFPCRCEQCCEVRRWEAKRIDGAEDVLDLTRMAATPVRDRLLGLAIACEKTVEVCKEQRHFAFAVLFKHVSKALKDALVVLDVCEDSNAVCICGCPVGDHENYGEDGEGCQHPEHECLRTSKAVYAVIHALREQQKERP